MKNNEFRRLSGLDRQGGFDGYQPAPETTRVLQRGLDAPLPSSMQETIKQFAQPYFDGHLTEAKKIKWEEKGDNVWGARVNVSSETYAGKTRGIEVALRIDGRSGTFRVDMTTMGPWEAIDDGKGFDTVAQAKAHADKWLAAATDQKTVQPKLEGAEEFPPADKELETALMKMHNTAADELASVLGQYADGPPLKGGWQASVAVKVDGDHRIYASIGDQYAPKPGVYEAIWGIQSGLGDKKDQDAYDLLWPSLVGLKDKLKKYGKVEDDRHHGSLIAKVWLRMNEAQARKYLGDMKALAAWWARSLSSRVEQAEREAAADKEMETR